MAGKRKSVDWAAIEPDYRAGVKSIKQIGRDHHLSDAAILKHAKKFGWTRDLSDAVRLRAAEKVSVAAVSGKVSGKTVGANQLTEKAIIEAGSDLLTQKIMSLRAKGDRLEAMFDWLADKLEANQRPGLNRATLLKLAQDLAGMEPDDASRKAKLLELFSLVSALPGTGASIGAYKTLTDAFRAVATELRQSYGIDKQANPESAVIAALKELRGIS